MDYELVSFVAEPLACEVDVAVLEISGRTDVWAWARPETRVAQALALQLL